ncbi:hypothetical protein HN51_038258 [Arachis hypogaea]|nr:uncharacterized protein DS421_13g436430 [Arachis hypogaea]
MACDATYPSSSLSTCMIFFFFSLFLVSHFTMAMLEHSFPTPLSSNQEGAKENTMVAASAREGGRSSTQSSSKVMALRESGKGLQVQGPREGRRRAPRPPLRRRNRFFNVSEHEVPSGPNPISN